MELQPVTASPTRLRLTASLGTMLGSALSPQRAVHNGGIGGESATSIRLRMVADQVFRDRVVTIWDRKNTGMPEAEYLAEIAMMVARVRERHDRFIILSDINKTDGTEAPGTAWRTEQDHRNAALLAAYPDNFLDVAGLLDDNSLRSDGLHLNPTGNSLVAAAINDFLVAKGW